MMMTFHESYGHLPMRLLRTYKKVNASPADHDQILAAFGLVWQDAESLTPETWEAITNLVASHSADGMLRLPYYL